MGNVVDKFKQSNSDKELCDVLKKIKPTDEGITPDMMIDKANEVVTSTETAQRWLLTWYGFIHCSRVGMRKPFLSHEGMPLVLEEFSRKFASSNKDVATVWLLVLAQINEGYHMSAVQSTAHKTLYANPQIRDSLFRVSSVALQLQGVGGGGDGGGGGDASGASVWCHALANLAWSYDGPTRQLYQTEEAAQLLVQAGTVIAEAVKASFGAAGGVGDRPALEALVKAQQVPLGTRNKLDIAVKNFADAAANISVAPPDHSIFTTEALRDLLIAVSPVTMFNEASFHSWCSALSRLSTLDGVSGKLYGTSAQLRDVVLAKVLNNDDNRNPPVIASSRSLESWLELVNKLVSYTPAELRGPTWMSSPDLLFALNRVLDLSNPQHHAKTASMVQHACFVVAAIAPCVAAAVGMMATQTEALRQRLLLLGTTFGQPATCDTYAARQWWVAVCALSVPADADPTHVVTIFDAGARACAKNFQHCDDQLACMFLVLSTYSKSSPAAQKAMCTVWAQWLKPLIAKAESEAGPKTREAMVSLQTLGAMAEDSN